MTLSKAKQAEKLAQKEIVEVPKPKKFETLNLKCDLTNDEITTIAKEMSEHLNKKKRAEDDLASFSAQRKADIKGHEAHINRSAILIQAGSEYRNIKCELVIDEHAGEVRWVRQDTFEVCQTEKPIPNRYLQTELPLVDEKEEMANKVADKVVKAISENESNEEED